MAEHTSGPWEYSEGADGEYRIYAPCFPGASRAVFDVADVWLPDRGDRAANGRLIAAAPDLYAALKLLTHAYVSLLETGHDRIIAHGGQCDPVDVMEAADPWLKAAREALAKVSIVTKQAQSNDEKGAPK